MVRKVPPSLQGKNSNANPMSDTGYVYELKSTACAGLGWCDTEHMSGVGGGWMEKVPTAGKGINNQMAMMMRQGITSAYLGMVVMVNDVDDGEESSLRMVVVGLW